MSRNQQRIEKLIALFEEGATDHSQEKELYAFFRNEKQVPDGLKKYIPVFHYFEEGLVADVARLNDHDSDRNVRPLWKKAVVVSAAACILLFAGIGVGNYFRFNEYEGSYLVRNEQRIYDRELIVSELAEIERKMQAKETEIQQLYQKTSEQFLEHLHLLNDQ